MSTLLHVILDRAPALATLAQECKGCHGTLCKGCHGTEHALGCPAGRSPGHYCCGMIDNKDKLPKPPASCARRDSRGRLSLRLFLRAILDRDHELQSRPDVRDRADLHVHQASIKPALSNHIFGEVGSDA